MPSPFQALLPIEGRVLLFKYEPFLPFCIADVSDSSESGADGELEVED